MEKSKFNSPRGFSKKIPGSRSQHLKSKMRDTEEHQAKARTPLVQKVIDAENAETAKE